jgi:hypothetical protein
VFVRRRVSVVDLVGDLAVFDQGPPPARAWVTVGAAELFGTEFCVGHLEHEEQLAPILMTLSSQVSRSCRLCWVGDRSGHEIEHPMAVVILGGLVTSTLLNVFLLPAIHLRFGRTR